MLKSVRCGALEEVVAGAVVVSALDESGSDVPEAIAAAAEVEVRRYEKLVVVVVGVPVETAEMTNSED